MSPPPTSPPPSNRSRRVRVLFAIDRLNIGGAEMVVRDLARQIDRNTFDVAICCTKGLGVIAEKMARDGLDVFQLSGASAEKDANYLTPIKLRRALKDRGIDVVHSHAPAAFWDAALCKLTLPRLKVVNTFHYGNYPNQSRSIRRIEGIASRVVDRLVAVGHRQREQIVRTYGLRSQDISTIWNGVAEPVAEDTAPFLAQVRAEKRLIVGTIATLIPQKGLDDLLLVAQRCRDRGLPMLFVILGEGRLRQDLERKRRELGLDDTVVLTGWFENAAGRALPAIDIFFQPSHWEAMSIAVLEAMATGRAILATRVGDNPTVLQHDVTGLLADVGSIDAMSDGLSRLCDADLRVRLGRAARDRYEEQFTQQHMIRAYEELYLNLVDAGA